MKSDLHSRREFLKTTALGASALSLGARAAEGAPPATRRNILLYVTDDQGTDDAGCYGHPNIPTPALDELAAHGMRFNRAYCSSPSCSASRSCILTGMHNHATGQYGHEHSYHHFRSFETLKSLPARLAEQGYRTIRAGKYHVGPPEVYPFTDVVPGAPTPEELANNCIRYLKNTGDKPFFLYFCTTEPHRPFKHQPEDRADPADVVVPSYLPDTPACREELADYYGSVRQADRGLERLVALLKEHGHWEDTLILYISDNGIPFPGAKTCVYEPGVRLPCVVRDPTAPAQGGATDAMVCWADLAPTICDYAGIDTKPEDFHGRSFLPVVHGEAQAGRDTVFGSHTFHEITMYYPMRWMRDGDWKLIWNIAHPLPFPFASDLYASKTWQDIVDRGAATYGKRKVAAYLQRPAFELYDLASDPDEIHNLAEMPEHAEKLAELQGKLREFQKRTGDPWVLKWKYE